MPEEFPEEPSLADSRYVLRLFVVKVEGVLIPSPDKWTKSTDKDISFGKLNHDNLFPDWSEKLDIPEDSLRNKLEDVASEGSISVNEKFVNFLNTVRNHTPTRVALLSSGPAEWIDRLVQSNSLEDVHDLSFCYDNYRHGTRKTLLQFLMNRFIAGKGRTLFLGESLRDERISSKEGTRFRSLEPPPENAIHPEAWNWSIQELKNFVNKVKAED